MVASNIFYVHPLPGVSKNFTNIFFRGVGEKPPRIREKVQRKKHGNCSAAPGHREDLQGAVWDRTTTDEDKAPYFGRRNDQELFLVPLVLPIG